jgi:hypothetical protein
MLDGIAGCVSGRIAAGWVGMLLSMIDRLLWSNAKLLGLLIALWGRKASLRAISGFFRLQYARWDSWMSFWMGYSSVRLPGTLQGR